MSLSDKFQEIFLLHQQGPRQRQHNSRPELSTSITKGVFILNPAARKLMGLYYERDKNVHFMFRDAQPRSGIILVTVGEAHGNHAVIPPEALKG